MSISAVGSSWLIEEASAISISHTSCFLLLDISVTGVSIASVSEPFIAPAEKM
jgi:hypothetical protein